jgi:hypothetical protein
MRYREIDEPVTGEEIAALAARIQAEIAYDRDRAPRRWPPMWWCEWVVSPWLSWRGRRPDAVLRRQQLRTSHDARMVVLRLAVEQACDGAQDS